MNKAYGSGTATNIQLKDEYPLFFDFLREDEYDEDGILISEAPRIYERAKARGRAPDCANVFSEL